MSYRQSFRQSQTKAKLSKSVTVALELFNHDAISNGDYNILFGAPESFIENKQLRDKLSSKFFVSNTICLVVDEVHKVVWEESQAGKDPFLKAFSKINELRSVCRIDMPILSLSATVKLTLQVW